MHRRYFVVFLLAITVACARRKANPDEPVPEFLADVALEVENRNFLDVTVYLIQHGNRQRLGTVTGSSTATVMIPKQFLRGYSAELRFLADPVGSPNAVVSDAVSLRPGEHIHWTLDKVGRSGMQSSIAVVQ